MKQHHDAGFTLVEMIVVISIIGIVLAFTIPNFTQGRRQEEVRSAQREFTADLRLAQTATISQHVDTADATKVDMLGLSIVGNSYTLFYGDGVRSLAEGQFTALKTQSLSPIVLTSTSLPSAGSLTLYFRVTRDVVGDAGTAYCVPANLCSGDITFNFATGQLPGFSKNVIIHPSGLIRTEK